MKLFDLDSPLISVLNKVADLMWLNILTLICCIPVITAGASFTALHYMALKIVRNEECYITRGYFKSFKENFKQATLIWLMLLLAIGIIAGDFYIITKTEMELNNIIKIIIMISAILVLFTATFVFPTLAKFDNPIGRTLKNAFIMSILQFPKTLLMIVLAVVPWIAGAFIFQIIPVVMLFGLSAPAWVSAMLYNKFFQKLEDQIMAANAPESPAEEEGEDERIFKDELDESIKIGEDVQ